METIFKQDKRLIGKNNVGSFNVEEIFQNQENVFREFIGVSPSPIIRIKSPFRSNDTSPGCRFKLFNGIWWLIDNATYRGKLYFNCIELVEYLTNLDFKGACNLIKDRLSLKGTYSDVLVIPDTTITEKIPIDIRFTYKKWQEDNYFTNKYKILPEYLNQQPYYNVENYWYTTKQSKVLKVNSWGIPKNRIAYYFEGTKHTKLYFPDNEKSRKWYANTTGDDIFGYHRMGNYLFNPNREIFITSSGKDEMLLNYYTEANSLGLQNESTLSLPDFLLRNLRYFDAIFIWLDADSTGRKYTKILCNYLKNLFPTKQIKGIYHDPLLGKDIADLAENLQYSLINYVKTIK